MEQCCDPKFLDSVVIQSFWTVGQCGDPISFFGTMGQCGNPKLWDSVVILSVGTV